MKYIYQDRNKDDLLVLLPGWATDYRIFSQLELPYNYLFVDSVIPNEFETSLLQELKKRKEKKISLLGWSLGGYEALQFAYKFPNRIAHTMVLGVRQKYEAQDIKTVKVLLKRNHSAYLNAFYTQCFSEHQNYLLWFKKNLFKEYCKIFSLEYLLKTLDYLSSFQIIEEKLLKNSKIVFIHGEKDLIAPLKGIEELITSTGADLLPISNAGHASFISKEFVEYVEKNNNN